MNDLGTKKGCLLLNEVPGLVAHTIKQEKEIKGIPIRKKCFVHWTYQCQHHGCDMVLKFYKMLPLGQGTTRLVQNWERSTSRLYAVTLLESKSEVAQSCPTLCEPMDCSPPCSSVHGVLQARILEWVAISFSKGSSWSRIQGRNPGLLHCRQILYHLSNQRRPSKGIHNVNSYAAGAGVSTV